MTYTLHCGDALQFMRGMDAGSVDCVLTDLPYGTTACKWDIVIPFAPMWAEVKRVLRPRGAFVTTASQPFTSALVMSNLAWFKYCWVWEKSRATGHLDCKRRPLRKHEDICVFSADSHTYNPIMQHGIRHSRGGARTGPAQVYGKFDDRQTTENADYYPTSIIPFSVVMVPGHPTQKPVALYKYFAETYTNKGQTVLDFCFGSGTTGVACMQLGRNFIGCEISPEYFRIAQKRIADAAAQPALFQLDAVTPVEQDEMWRDDDAK